MSTAGTTVMVQKWIDALSHDDKNLGLQAREELIEHSKRRMEALCRKMFFPSLQGKPVGWEDVYQEAALRLWNVLDEEHPKTVRDFFGLAALQIRRVLVDMCRKFNKKIPVEVMTTEGASTLDPAKVVVWADFHESVEKLEPHLREVVQLLWYHELTQDEAAEVMGVHVRTVKRHWREARTQLVAFLP